MEGHENCRPGEPNHGCTCHINPPCQMCVECPAWDEEGA